MSSLVRRVQHLEEEMLILKNKDLRWDVKYQKLKANFKLEQYNLTSKVEAQERILEKLVLAAGMQPSSAHSNSSKHGTSKNRQAYEVAQNQQPITMGNGYTSKFSVRDEDGLNSLYTDGRQSNEVEKCRKKNVTKETVYNENYDNTGDVEVCFDANEQWEQNNRYDEEEYTDQQYWSGLDGSNGQSYITADAEDGVESEFNFQHNTHAFHDYSMMYEGQSVTHQVQQISINRGEQRTVKQSENESASKDIQVRKKKKLRKNKSDSESAVATKPNAETVKTSKKDKDKKDRTGQDNSAQLARTFDFSESNILQKSKIKIHSDHRRASSVLTDQIYSTDTVPDVSEIEISKQCGNTGDCINKDGAMKTDHVTTSGQYSASDMSGSEIAGTQEVVGMPEVAKTHVTLASGLPEFIQPPNPRESKGENDKNDVFECNKCWQIFLTIADMDTHSREVHSFEYKFWCLKCNICFVNKKEFQTHELVHSGPFHCKHCNKSFRYFSNLNRHEKTHVVYETEVKSNDTSEQHACIMCPKKFDDLSDLKDHLFTHEEGNRLECLSCSKKFGQKDTLIRHCIQYDHVPTLL